MRAAHDDSPDQDDGPITTTADHDDGGRSL
jgi:hypothetical protein